MTDASRSTFHRAKGWFERFFGWATGDRRVEAEGIAEETTERPPTEQEVEAAEQVVKERQTEIVDDRPGG